MIFKKFTKIIIFIIWFSELKYKYGKNMSYATCLQNYKVLHVIINSIMKAKALLLSMGGGYSHVKTYGHVPHFWDVHFFFKEIPKHGFHFSCKSPSLGVWFSKYKQTPEDFANFVCFCGKIDRKKRVPYF